MLFRKFRKQYVTYFHNEFGLVAIYRVQNYQLQRNEYMNGNVAELRLKDDRDISRIQIEHDCGLNKC